MERYAVIMAGGGGTRFWPLSRDKKPKHLLNISGKDTLVNESIARLQGLIPLDRILIVSNKKQKELMEHILPPDLPRENILLEPSCRNTAACIAYAALHITSLCPEAVLCILPSDHYIHGEEAYRKALSKAFTLAEATDSTIMIGIRPTFPSTGYGYIKYNPESEATMDGAYPVERFVEKPLLELARQYVSSGCYLWNSGIFVWKANVILMNIQRFLPRLYRSMHTIRGMLQNSPLTDSIEGMYNELPNISIDTGVLERSDDMLVIPSNFGWNDVGSWDALGRIFPTDSEGNIIKANHLGLDTRNSVIYGTDRLIATIGVDNLIIADTQDALLICPKNKSQDVKTIVELLRQNGLHEYM